MTGKCFRAAACASQLLQAKCAIVWISAGTASIVATYSGDTDYGGSKSATLDQVVTSTVKATTTNLCLGQPIATAWR